MGVGKLIMRTPKVRIPKVHLGFNACNVSKMIIFCIKSNQSLLVNSSAMPWPMCFCTLQSIIVVEFEQFPGFSMHF